MLRFCWIMAVTSLFIINGIMLIGTIGNRYIRKKVLFKLEAIETLCIAIIAYNIVPNETLDLYRYFEIIDFFKTHSFFDAAVFMGTSYNGVTGSLFDLFCYLIARFSNPNLLTFIVTFLYYGIVKYITVDSMKEQQINFFKIFFLKIFNFAITMIVFNVTGLRYPLAIALFCLGLYIYLYKEGNIFFTVIIEILAVLIHFGILPFILLFVLLRFIKKNNKLIVFVLASWSIWGMTIASIFMKVPNNIISSLGWKLRYYIIELPNGWDFNLYFGCIIIVLILIWCSIKNSNLLGGEYEVYCFWCLFLIIGSVWYRQLLMRFTYAMAILGMPYVCKIICLENNTSIRKVHPRVFIMELVMILLTIIQIRLTWILYMPEINWLWEV